MAPARSADRPTPDVPELRTDSGGGVGPGPRCLEGVLARPGATAAEIAIAAGVDRRRASRRLPDLRTAGLVTNGPARVCAVTGRLSKTWLPGAEVRP